MNQQDMINAIARKLYRFTRRDIAEVVEVMLELWQAELVKPEGYVHLTGIGKLYVEQQQIPGAGVVKDTLRHKYGRLAPPQLKRVYFRFRPSERLKLAVLERSQSDE